MTYAAGNKVKARIKQGENQFIEFKEQKVHPDSIAKEMAAFANTQGGTILIGVSDQTEICGVDDSRNWEEWVANISRHNIIPAIQADCIIVEIEGKKIVVVDIPKGNDKP